MIFEMLIGHSVEFLIEHFAEAGGIDWLIEFIENLVNLLPYFKEIISYAYFFLPVDYFIPLFSVVFGIIAFRIVIAIVKLIIDVVPVW
ncbi:MAG: hypothetical protein J6C06_08045 [Lachnospiraceae bacterium]|nr:hypothetical protein [Lachnospiraceae bacterium]